MPFRKIPIQSPEVGTKRAFVSKGVSLPRAWKESDRLVLTVLFFLFVRISFDHASNSVQS